MRRALIIACSQRKLRSPKLLPALERYNGPAFQVLRKYLREHGDHDLKIFILSAKYGFIKSDKRIPDYDVRLDRDGAKRLRSSVTKAARENLARVSWQTIGICAGKDYRTLLESVSEQLSDDVSVELIEGGQGLRLTTLKRWLLKTF